MFFSELFPPDEEPQRGLLVCFFKVKMACVWTCGSPEEKRERDTEGGSERELLFRLIRHTSPFPNALNRVCVIEH